MNHGPVREPQHYDSAREAAREDEARKWGLIAHKRKQREAECVASGHTLDMCQTCKEGAEAAVRSRLAAAEAEGTRILKRGRKLPSAAPVASAAEGNRAEEDEALTIAIVVAVLLAK